MTSAQNRITRTAALVLLVLGLLSPTISTAGAADTPPRVDLRLLLVADSGTEPAIQAWASALDREGIPYDLVALQSDPIPALTAGDEHALYQGVVLSNAWQPSISSEDNARLEAFEATYGLRRVLAYAYPAPNLGMEEAGEGGPIDDSAWRVTADGASTFSSLAGPVPVDGGAYGYRSKPIDADFTTLVGDAEGNSLVGSHVRDDGVEELVVTVDSNPYMSHALVMAHGLINWVTQGVHLGYQRSYMTVHVDDVFLPDSRWSIEGNCTPLDDCPADVPLTEDIRMTPADVERARQWQRDRGLRLSMAYNGAGTDEAVAESGSDALTDAFLAAKGEFEWINHTYEHTYLGCIQDFTVVPWRCATDAAGTTQWYSRDDIIAQIKKNIDFAAAKGLPINPRELVTGEHSGLASLPQMPEDNPFLGDALNKAGIKVVASDASREPAARAVGKARTEPRHPNNIFYNVATVEELVDEYNHLYLPPHLGGKCENTAFTTCRSDPASFEDIISTETGIMQLHVLGNDPRPTFMHQSNLAEDGVAYPLLDRMVERYRSWFTAPLLQPTMTETVDLLDRSDRFGEALRAGQITAYRVGDEVHIDAPKNVRVPVTAPMGTRVGSAVFGSSYGGEQSDWIKVGKNPTVLTLG